MKAEFGLASDWKMLSGAVGIIFLYSFARFAYDAIDLLGFFLSQEISLLRALSATFMLLLLLAVLSLCGFVVYFFLYKISKERLTIDEANIEHESFGYTLRSKWINAKRIRSTGPFGLVNGIYVIPDNVDKWKNFLARLFVGTTPQGEMFIPLSLFDANWRVSEMGRQIKQYAPHLFTEENIVRVNP